MATALGGAGKAKAAKSQRSLVTYRLPVSLKDAMLENVVHEKYGLKGKSRWIDEAIRGFLKETSWKDQALDGDMVMEHGEKDVAYVDPSTKESLDQARRELVAYATDMANKGIRQDNIDQLDVTVSSIVRAAIVWRLFDLRMPVIKLNNELKF